MLFSTLLSYWYPQSKGKHVTSSTKFPTLLSVIYGEWNQFLKPCITIVSLIMYVYIIILTLAMTVDIKNIGRIDQYPLHQASPSSELLNIRWEINLIFLIIMHYLFKRRSFIIKTYLNCYLLLSLKKLVKRKTNPVVVFGYFLSYWIMTLKLLLLIICYPGILNPGPVISGLYQNVRGYVPFHEIT